MKERGDFRIVDSMLIHTSNFNCYINIGPPRGSRSLHTGNECGRSGFDIYGRTLFSGVDPESWWRVGRAVCAVKNPVGNISITAWISNELNLESLLTVGVLRRGLLSIILAMVNSQANLMVDKLVCNLKWAEFEKVCDNREFKLI